MTKTKAGQLIRAKVKQENGVTPRLKWLDWGSTTYPSGLRGHWGKVQLSATGYRTTVKTFTSTTDGGWLLQ